MGAAALPANGPPFPPPDPATGAIPLETAAASGVPDEGPVTLSIFLFNPPATAGLTGAPGGGGLAPLTAGFGFGFCATLPP